MLAELGGVTLMAMLLSVRGVRPGVLLFWVLFLLIAALHTYGIPLP